MRGICPWWHSTEPTSVSRWRSTNVCAIVGLFCALTGLFVPALVFGAIGYVETGGREHETGSGLAVAALILGAIELKMFRQ
jgi:hypothetical protein